MKPTIHLLTFLALLESHIITCSFAHDTPIHEKISENAALASPELTGFLRDQFGIAESPFVSSPRLYFAASGEDNVNTGVGGPIGWIRIGSRTEDNFPRFKNHFFDPTKDPAIGLTDGINLFGIPSFTWGSIRGGGASQIFNNDSWQNARDYEWAGLTNSDKSYREALLGHLFYALGKVIHLNQDLSQPDHTRNDNHNPKFPQFERRDIEEHGFANYEKKPAWFTAPPESQRGWTYWRDAGFTKLEAFWDRNLYAGSATQMKQAAR